MSRALAQIGSIARKVWRERSGVQDTANSGLREGKQMATQIHRRTSVIWDATPAVRDEARIREFKQLCPWGEGACVYTPDAKVKRRRAEPMGRFEDADVKDGGIRLRIPRPDLVSYAPGSMAVPPREIQLKEIR